MRRHAALHAPCAAPTECCSAPVLPPKMPRSAACSTMRRASCTFSSLFGSSTASTLHATRGGRSPVCALTARHSYVLRTHCAPQPDLAVPSARCAPSPVLGAIKESLAHAWGRRPLLDGIGGKQYRLREKASSVEKGSSVGLKTASRLLHFVQAASSSGDLSARHCSLPRHQPQIAGARTHSSLKKNFGRI